MSDISSYLPLWGQWRTEKLIGEGPDSKVYRAVRDTQDGQEYAAIKQITVAPTEDPAVSERRARSLLALADRQIALRGKPHLAEYYERQAFRHADGGYDVFVRMELLTSLRSVMGKTAFSEAMLSHLGQDITDALLALEEEGTCHGAIHPANLFLSRDGSYKLGDYCRSRIRSFSGSAREYLAPEVLTGSSMPSVGSDRYALGMVLYRLANALRGPFLPPAPATVSREDIVQADRRRVRGEKLPLPANASSRMAAILQRACAFLPENRYLSTVALQHELELLTKPEAEAEIPDETPQLQTEIKQTSSAAKKRNPVFLLGIILAAAIMLAGGVTAALLVKAQQKRHTEPSALTTATQRQTQAPAKTEPPLQTQTATTQAASAEPVTTAVPTEAFELNSAASFVDFDIPASGYVLADSDTRYITADDLAGMTKNQCRLACNEIYARKGRLFSSKTIADYFNAMPWYHGTVEGSYFDSHQDSYLTAIELANARTIVQYERSKGWR